MSENHEFFRGVITMLNKVNTRTYWSFIFFGYTRRI